MHAQANVSCIQVLNGKSEEEFVLKFAFVHYLNQASNAFTEIYMELITEHIALKVF